MQFTSQAKTALQYARTYAGEMGHPAGTEHLLLGLCREPEGTASQILNSARLDIEQISEYMHDMLGGAVEPVPAGEVTFTPRAEKVLEQAEGEAVSFHSRMVGTEHILMALLKDQESMAVQILHKLDFSTRKLYAALLVAMGQSRQLNRDPFITGKNKKRPGGQSVLERYSRNLTELAAAGSLDPVIGRESELMRMMQILSRKTKNNPCLIGEPGVGKTAIVEALAQRIASGDVPEPMQNKKVVTLDLTAMVAGSKYRGEFEERIKGAINEVMAAGNILLFVDEIHTIIGAGGAEGAMDASNILKPSLSRGEIQLIGATTIDEYRKHIEKDAALERRFQPVMVEEPDRDQTLAILKGLRPRYEEYHRIHISDQALEAAVSLSQRYISDRFLPDKAIDLMDETMAQASLKGYTQTPRAAGLEAEVERLEEEKEQAIIRQDFEAAARYKQEQAAAEEKLKKSRQHRGGRQTVVEEEQIAQVVSQWTRIPVSRMERSEGKKLMQLEKTLAKRVVGQSEAVQAVARAVRRGRAGLKDPARPTGSFLFLGPTGVGKTELTKALAEAVFGSEEALIRVDMSEYMEKHSVSKLIGAPPGYVGYDEGGQLSEKVRRRPYSVVLFDEIEKAHPDVFHMLLQVLDDGHLTDAQGRKISFKNTIIIMTSNAGASAIMEPKRLGFVAEESREADYQLMKDRVMEEVRRLFRPEFLNRIDDTIVFHPLTKEDVNQIAGILLKGLLVRCREQMDIVLKVQPSARDLLVEKGFDPKYGVRPMKRTIQNLLEDALAEEILSGNVGRGQTVTVTKRGEKLVFRGKDTETTKQI